MKYMITAYGLLRVQISADVFYVNGIQYLFMASRKDRFTTHGKPAATHELQKYTISLSSARYRFMQHVIASPQLLVQDSA